MPALSAARPDLVTALKSGSRSGGRRSRLQGTLLIVQSALSMLLLVGAGLFVRSLENARNTRLGYDPESLILAQVNLRGANVGPADLGALATRLREAASATPGVTHTAFAASAPFLSNDQVGLVVPGVDSVNSRGRFLIQLTTPGYFATMGTRILRGRPLGEQDRSGFLAALSPAMRAATVDPAEVLRGE